MTEYSCKEKPEVEVAEEHRGKRVLILLIASLWLAMVVAALGAVYLVFFFEAATVLFLYSLAEYFEGYIQDRARRTVEKLSSFMPDKARVIVDGSENSMNVGEVQIGLILLVKPGERIPLDGNVVEGSSQVDRALVPGGAG